MKERRQNSTVKIARRKYVSRQLVNRHFDEKDACLIQMEAG